MSLSREVAEAYIQVHGDMSPFRRDLEKARDDIRKLAQEEGVDFGDHFARSLRDKLDGQWQSILDANFRDGKIDWDRAINAFDSKNLDEARDKMHQFVLEMEELGKLEGPDGNMFERLVDSIDDAINSRQEYEDITRRNAEAQKAEIARFKEARTHEQAFYKSLIADAYEAQRANEAFDRTFDGMSRKIKKAGLDADFTKIATAMQTMDFGEMMRGFDSFDKLRDRVTEVTAAMEEQGRVTRGNTFEISAAVEDWISNQDEATTAVTRTRNESNRFAGVWKALLPVLDRNVAKLKGFAGLNVLGRMVGEGSQFFQQIDEMVLKIGKATLLFGGLAASGISAIGGIATVAADLTTTIGGLAVVLPGFLVGAAIQAAVLKSAFQDMGTVLADLAPAFHRLQDSISAKFWAQAEEPVRNMVSTLLPTLTTQLNNTGTSLGGVFGKLAAAVGAIPLPAITAMFERMNAGIDIAGGAMKPLIEAFTTLGTAASLYFERFGTWITNLSTRFNNFIQAASADGRLIGWIDSMIEGFKQLGVIVAGAWGIMDALNRAAIAAGGQGMATLADNISKVSDALNSVTGQQVLAGLFSAANLAVIKVKDSIIGIGPALLTVMPTVERTISTIGTIIAKVVSFIGTIISNPAFLNGANDFMVGLQQGVGALTPAMPAIAESLGQVLSLLGLVAPLVGNLVAAFLTSFGPALDQVAAAFGRIAQVAGPQLTGIINSLGPVFQQVMGILLPPLENLVNTVLPLANQLFAALAPIFPVIAAAIAPVIDAVTQLINMIGPSLVPAFQSIVAAVSPVIAVFGQVVSFVLSVLVPILGILIIGVINNVVGVFQGLSNFIMGFVKIVTAIFTGFGEFFTKLFQGDIGGALGALGTMFASIWDGIVQMLTGALQFLWNAVQLLFIGKLIGGIRVALSNISGFFSMIWNNIVAFLKGAMGNINGTVITGFNAVKGFITTIFNAVKSFITTVWTSIWTWIKTVVGNIGSAISTGFNAAKSFISTVWNAILNVIKTVWTAIVNTVKAAITGYVNLVTSAFNNLRNFISTVWNAITNVIRTVWTWIVNTARAGVSNLTSNVTAGFNAVRNFISSVWNGIVNIISTVWNWIGNTVRAGVSMVQNFVSSGFNAARNIIASVWNSAVSMVQSAWSSMVGAVSNGVSNVLGWIGSLPGRISGALGNVWGLLTGAGRAIIDGLLSGLKAAWGGVTSFVGGIADWIARNKGPIPYDRKLLVPAGNAIMFGLENSLKDKFGNVMDFVSSMADMMADGFDKSKMYLAGADASQGLADGLLANKSKIKGAYSDLGQLAVANPALGTIRASGSDGRTSDSSDTGARVTLAEGAVQVVTRASDPRLVAGAVTDGLDEAFSVFSKM